METPRSLSNQALRGILVPALLLLGFGVTAAASPAHDIASHPVPSVHRACTPWLYRACTPWLYGADATGKTPWLY